MKKILSLVLALCMALTAAAALAEGDVTGTWYIKMFGATAGSVDLDAQGKCVLTSQSASGETVVKEGTWALDGTTLTLTIDNESLPLNWDGENLTMDVASLLELVPEAGSINLGGADLSMFNNLLEISRDPGKISFVAFNAYQADGTLPEGVTEEEMQAFQAEIMNVLLQTLSSMSTAAAAETVPADAITVLEENFIIHDNYGSQGATCLMKIQNTADTAVALNEMVLTMKDADGYEIGRGEYPNVIGSNYLEPGEITYASITADIFEGATVAEHEIVFTPTSTTWMTPDASLEISDVELRAGEFGSYIAAGTVINKGEKALSSIRAVFAIRDEAGNLVDVTSAGMYGLELPVGSSIILLGNMNYSLSEYCAANKIVPTSVEAYALTE